MPKGPTKRRPQTRASLLRAARELFADKGFGATSIGDICGLAGYTSGAFYSNFASKDALFFELFDEHAQQVVDRMQARLARIRANEVSMEEAIAALTEIGPDERNWYLISTEFTLYAIRNPEAAQLLAERDAKVRSLFAPILHDILAELGAEPPVDLDHLTRLIVALREGGLTQSLVEPDRLTPGELDRTYLPAVLTGLTKVSPSDRISGPPGQE